MVSMVAGGARRRYPYGSRLDVVLASVFRRRLRNVLSLLILSLAAGCAFAPGYKTPQEAPPDVRFIPITAQLDARLGTAGSESDSDMHALMNDGVAGAYRIGPHDVLSISIWDSGGNKLDLTPVGFGLSTASGYVVAADGAITFPFVGKVRVAGKTTDQVRAILADRIKTTILNPQIEVGIAEYHSRKAYVVGDVVKPGEIPIKARPLTIIDAISQAGGTTKTADLAGVTLKRANRVYDINLLALLKEGKASRNIVLRDGDVLYVPDNSLRKVYVIGEVLKPASLPMVDGRMSLTEAINDAGGINPNTSNPAQIFVIRGKPKAPQVYHLDAADPVALILGDHFPLRPRDVVYVDTSGITRWSRVINQVLPTASFFGTPNLYGKQGG